jgi:class 3 adenylate cyclase
MDIPPYLMETYKAVMRKGTTEELYIEIDNLKRDPNPIAQSQLVPVVEEIIRERAAAIDSRDGDTIGFGFMTPEQKVAYRAKMAARRLERERVAAKKRE